MSAKAETTPKVSSGTASRLATGGLLQRKCACGGSAGLTGSCSDCDKKKLLGQPLQRKLTISEPGDVYEQEADRVAEQVMQMSPADVSRRQNGKMAQPVVQRRVTSGTSGLTEAPPIVHEVLNSPGQPLDATTRAFFEPRFGQDFSQVRVHTNNVARESARAVNAHAYSVRSNIVFGAGQYRPEAGAGQHLLAHELTHVVQQMSPGGGAMAVRPLVGSLVQRQSTIPFPRVGPMPTPRVGPMPRVGPVPEVGPMPPIVIPYPGDYEPELEIKEAPQEEPLDGIEDVVEPAPEPTPQPKTERKPQPEPLVGPQPRSEEKEGQEFCGSKRMPLTNVTWSTGPHGQGGTVRASPLTRCPGNTVGSLAQASTYMDQFRCIKRAGLSRTWLPLHLLHGATRRTGSRNLHGPGNKRWNIVIGDTAMNGKMYKAVEDFVINRVYDWNQVLWLESKVEAYFPGNEFFAKRIRLAWGLYSTTTNSEVSTIGGETFDSNNVPPRCPPTSPSGAASLGVAGASGFDTTIGICEKSLRSKKNFPVSDGGLELTLRTHVSGGDCNIRDYTVTLWKFNKYWIDGKFGSKAVPAGKTVRLSWRKLPLGDYYLVFELGPHQKGCCLNGDMSVRTFYAKPGGEMLA